MRGVTYNLAARAESKLTSDPETGEDTYEDVITPEGAELRSGLIADEVEEISEFAHLISLEEKINRGEVTPYKGLNYNGFIPYLIKSIQELSAKVTTLENA